MLAAPPMAPATPAAFWVPPVEFSAVTTALPVGFTTAPFTVAWAILSRSTIAAEPAALALLAVAGVVVVGLFSVARQVRSAPAPGFGWVTAYEAMHAVALVAVLFVVADAVVERLRPGAATTSAYDDPA